jgi:hypothetical protein
MVDILCYGELYLAKTGISDLVVQRFGYVVYFYSMSDIVVIYD